MNDQAKAKVNETLTAGFAAAREFQEDMQAMVDKPGSGFSSVSISTDGGKTYIPIAEKQPIKTSTMQKTETLNLKCVLTDEEMMTISKDMAEHLNKKKQPKMILPHSAHKRKLKLKDTKPLSIRRPC